MNNKYVDKKKKKTIMHFILCKIQMFSIRKIKYCDIEN